MGNQAITVDVSAGFIEKQAGRNRFVFFYTVFIHNNSAQACQLISRHWVITDGNNGVAEVVGDGVVGEQPVIQPGDTYKYTSGAVLDTEMGTMEGRYFMVWKEPTGDQEPEFEVPIPQFLLSAPRTLH